MKPTSLIAAAALFATALAAPLAQAKNDNKPAAGSGPSCSAGSTVVSFIDCAGSFEGNLRGAPDAAQIAALNAQFGDNGFTYSNSLVYSKSDAAGHGVFTSLGDDFTLTFDNGQVATGLFVIGLKQATRYSFYLFDGGSAGINSISFDVKGVVDKQTDGLSHAIYLGNALTAPVPEPESYALMLAGLGVVGFIARRRARRG
jgi:hypothetical protein